MRAKLQVSSAAVVRNKADLELLRKELDRMRAGHLQELVAVKAAFQAQLAQELEQQEANHTLIWQAAFGGAASAGGSRAAFGGGAASSMDISKQEST